ncbi:MAG TPA: orotate phosphoribosyltransferase [Nitrospiria bacterium]
MDKRQRAEFRRRLLLMLRGSFVYGTDPIHTLSSGRKSHFYIDCKKITLNHEGAFLVGNLILDVLADVELDAIGGMTLGADPIATAASVLSYGEDRHFSAFIVRKEPKPFTSGIDASAFIEGPLPKGARVVVVDDVLTSGRATERTIKILVEAGCRVMKVIALVDRKEGGRQHLEGLGYPVECLFTVEDLLKA